MSCVKWTTVSLKQEWCNKNKKCVFSSILQTKTGNEQIHPPQLLRALISHSVCLPPSSSSSSSSSFLFTHHLHLRKKPFELLEVESGAAEGGTAAGSLAQPKHRVQHLGGDRGAGLVHFIHAKHTSIEVNVRKKEEEEPITTHIF